MVSVNLKKYNMQQAGITSIKLYENKGLSVTYTATGEVFSVANTGELVILNESDSNPSFAFGLPSSKNSGLIHDYSIVFHINEISENADEVIHMLTASPYGWVPEIELKSGDTVLIESPFFANFREVDTNSSHTYFIEARPKVLTAAQIKFYE